MLNLTRKQLKEYNNYIITYLCEIVILKRMGMQMSKTAVVALANGFEEMEAVISIDILRRAGVSVISAAINDNLLVKGARNITVQADVLLKDLAILPDAFLLPGGSVGAKNLAESDAVNDILQRCFQQGKIVAAICASPACVLAKAGILEGKKATCYPSFEKLFSSQVVYSEDAVVVDGNIITSRGPGTAFDFAFAVVQMLCGVQVAQGIKEQVLID